MEISVALLYIGHLTTPADFALSNGGEGFHPALSQNIATAASRTAPP